MVVYVGGAMEQFFTKSGNTWSAAKTRIYVSGPSGVIGVFNHDPNATSAASNTASWLLKDHLGSVDTVLTMNGTQVQAQRYSYDAWGQRRDAATWAVQDPATVSSTATDRGFTGHEMLDATGLVHMNGRIYDPLLGRFLSADPHVQSPQDLQSYNRYTYVNNNPVSFTDSTGFFIDKLFKKVGNFFKKYWKVIVAIAVTVVTAGLAAWAMLPGVTSFAGAFSAMAAGVGFWSGVTIGAIAGFAGGVTGALLNGAGLSGALKGGLQGALSGAAAGAVGGWFSGMSGHSVEAARALAHGVSQGAVAEAFGGDFGSSFLAGAFGSLGGHYSPLNGFWGKLVSAALVGGSAAEIGGGKFANGAVSGAFTYLFNQFLHQQQRSRYTVGIMSNVSENNRGPLIDGHAVLVVRDNQVGNQTTYALWPDGHPDIQAAGLSNGAGSDVRIDFLPDDPSGYAYQYWKDITPAQHTNLMAAISEDHQWGYLNNCSSFASDMFYFATGVDVDVDEFLGIETPRELGQNIQRLNAGRASNSASPAPAGNNLATSGF